MSINATLFVQAIVFAILVWFTMKFVWPPIAAALDERAQKIADGLAAAQVVNRLGDAPRIDPLLAIFDQHAARLPRHQLIVLRSTVSPGTTARSDDAICKAN